MDSWLRQVMRGPLSLTRPKVRLYNAIIRLNHWKLFFHIFCLFSPHPPGRSSQVPVLTETLGCAQQVVCGQNCTFIVTANGSILACGEGSYGRLGQGNSDDLHTPTVISTLQGDATPLSDKIACTAVSPMLKSFFSFLFVLFCFL